MRDGDVQSGAGAVFVPACASTATVDNVNGIISSGGHRTQGRGRKRSSDGSLKGIVDKDLLERVERGAGVAAGEGKVVGDAASVDVGS